MPQPCFCPMAVDAGACWSAWPTFRQGALAEPWTRDRLASIAHLSPKQLSRVFTETCGKTPVACLTMRHVEEMASLLRETDLTNTTDHRRSRTPRGLEQPKPAALSEHVGLISTVLAAAAG